MLIKKQVGIPVLLICLFMLPFLIALWCYQHGGLRWTGQVNQGRLVRTPTSIPGIQPSHKWRIVYVASEPCGAACLHAVDTLARVRLALGRHLYGIELWLFVMKDNPLKVKQLSQQLNGMDVQVKAMWRTPTSLRDMPVWVIDSQGQAVMAYPDTSRPRAIYADLKQLSRLWTH